LSLVPSSPPASEGWRMAFGGTRGGHLVTSTQDTGQEEHPHTEECSTTVHFQGPGLGVAGRGAPAPLWKESRPARTEREPLTVSWSLVCPGPVPRPPPAFVPLGRGPGTWGSSTPPGSGPPGFPGLQGERQVWGHQAAEVTLSLATFLQGAPEWGRGSPGWTC
jgi:hypothetical protein